MQRSPLGLRIPDGMRDLLPEEINVQEKLEKQVLALFGRWSYQKVATPTLEYAACVQPEGEQEDELYKFFDRRGRVLALRPELTTPIARLVSTRMRGAGFPLRYCYGADVFRNSDSRYREFRQLGVELIGSDAELADAEVIALAVESFKVLGIKDFQLNLGHMGIFSELMTQSGVQGELRNKIEEALARKDFVAIELLAARSGLPEKAQSLLQRLPHLHGSEEMLDEILTLSESADTRAAVESLRRVYGYLRDFGVQQNIALDFGILRGFSYYTGAVFEGYVPTIGHPVLEGGRYDSLYADFGFPQPATGFAIHLGSISELFQPENMQVPAADVLVGGTDPQKVIARCRDLRAEGKVVEMTLKIQTEAEAEKLAEEKGIPDCCYLD